MEETKFEKKDPHPDLFKESVVFSKFSQSSRASCVRLVSGLAVARYRGIVKGNIFGFLDFLQDTYFQFPHVSKILLFLDFKRDVISSKKILRRYLFQFLF